MGAMAGFVELRRRRVVAMYDWREAFHKFGFGDGDGDVRTEDVAQVLREHGYEVVHARWGLHNDVICSISMIHSDGTLEELVGEEQVGYDHPESYLPAEIVRLLDRECG